MIQAINQNIRFASQDSLTVSNLKSQIRETADKVDLFFKQLGKIMLTCLFGMLTAFMAPGAFLFSGAVGLLPERKFPASKDDYVGAGVGFGLTLLFSKIIYPPVPLGHGVASFSGYYFGQMIRDEYLSK